MWLFAKKLVEDCSVKGFLKMCDTVVQKPSVSKIFGLNMHENCTQRLYNAVEKTWFHVSPHLFQSYRFKWGAFSARTCVVLISDFLFLFFGMEFKVATDIEMTQFELVDKDKYTIQLARIFCFSTQQMVLDLLLHVHILLICTRSPNWYKFWY